MYRQKNPENHSVKNIYKKINLVLTRGTYGLILYKHVSAYFLCVKILELQILKENVRGNLC